MGFCGNFGLWGLFFWVCLRTCNNWKLLVKDTSCSRLHLNHFPLLLSGYWPISDDLRHVGRENHLMVCWTQRNEKVCSIWSQTLIRNWLWQVVLNWFCLFTHSCLPSQSKGRKEKLLLWKTYKLSKVASKTWDWELIKEQCILKVWRENILKRD